MRDSSYIVEFHDMCLQLKGILGVIPSDITNYYNNSYKTCIAPNSSGTRTQDHNKPDLSSAILCRGMHQSQHQIEGPSRI